VAIGGVNFERRIAKNCYNNLQRKTAEKKDWETDERTRIISKLLKYISSRIITFVRS
jgi:hypothetical protein